MPFKCDNTFQKVSAKQSGSYSRQWQRQSCDISLHSVLGGLHLQNCVKFWLPQTMKDKDGLERAQRRTMKMIKGLESTHCKKDWRKFSLLSLEKAQGDLITLFEYLNSIYRVDRGSLFTKRTHKEKTRSYRYKLLLARFHLNRRKICWWWFFGLV